MPADSRSLSVNSQSLVYSKFPALNQALRCTARTVAPASALSTSNRARSPPNPDFTGNSHF